MVTLVFVVLAVLVVLGVVLVLTGRIDPGVSSSGRAPAPVLPDAPLSAEDVAGLRFRVGLRGYRQQDVDAALAVLAEQLRQEGYGGQEAQEGPQQ